MMNAALPSFSLVISLTRIKDMKWFKCQGLQILTLPTSLAPFEVYLLYHLTLAGRLPTPIPGEVLLPSSFPTTAVIFKYLFNLT